MTGEVGDGPSLQALKESLINVRQHEAFLRIILVSRLLGLMGKMQKEEESPEKRRTDVLFSYSCNKQMFYFCNMIPISLMLC